MGLQATLKVYFCELDTTDVSIFYTRRRLALPLANVYVRLRPSGATIRGRKFVLPQLLKAYR